MPTKCRCVLLIPSIFLLLSFHGLSAQEVVLPAYSGGELLDSLVSQYKPVISLTYAQARDTLYSKIRARQDSLSCIYTGYTIYLDLSQDPTVSAFMQGINAEHIYPRAKGAEGEIASSDMHNLFPSREDVNTDRADLRFGEIPDPQTLSWYYSDRRQSSIPITNADAYSELGSDRFEPRESVKGNIARAMFYFYTMYQTEADLADPDYFALQKNTLCDWHAQDPVDQEEWNHNLDVANYQNHKPNPYILDCSLAFRAFCPEDAMPIADCGFTATKEKPEPAPPFIVHPGFPNPFTTEVTLRYDLQERARVQLQIVDALGRPLTNLLNLQQMPGQYGHTFSTNALPAGIYCLQISVSNGTQLWSSIQRIIKL